MSGATVQARGIMRQLGRNIGAEKLTLAFALLLAGIVLIAVFAPAIAGYDPVDQSLLDVNTPPRSLSDLSLSRNYLKRIPT